MANLDAFIVLLMMNPSWFGRPRALGKMLPGLKLVSFILRIATKVRPSGNDFPALPTVASGLGASTPLPLVRCPSYVSLHCSYSRGNTGRGMGVKC